MHSLAALIAPSAQTALNTFVWLFSAALQLALFSVLFTRGLARRVPVFTALIGFYLARSILLYLIFGHIDLTTYRALYDNLQIVDLLLQAGVAIEIAIHLSNSQPNLTLRRGLTPLALLALAVSCTALATTMLPPQAPIPADRAQLFFSFLMILLFVWAQTTPATLTRNIAAGFALYGVVNLTASFGRTYAALHENFVAYAIWSYLLAAIYLVAILYWLVTLKPLQLSPAAETSPPSTL
ncbi:hypothetical protein GCM10011507_21400 [Edaphobacter acidisoli]|uniref:Uncharacterized protein n=1 Tax=Edaphobacter acidisoli TaxID=2040573 RepID=A0A916RUG8_9BACT|nr:hypothetical protein [Edaphobacter acidisoli]GGA69593.1 hypothetical protein GCM10011507_21400 [Edaphobacter acidisoli]